jgi:DNA polymerase I-like protein with 3'-5' exonuclease and polymerase domains
LEGEPPPMTDPYVAMRMPILHELIIPLNERGICLDRKRRDQLRAERLDRLATWRKRAKSHFERLGVDLPLGKKGAPSSPKLHEILYDVLLLPEQTQLKDPTRRTAGKDALKNLRKSDPSGTVDLMLEYSAMKDALVPLMARESPDGRMRTRFVLGGDEKFSDDAMGRTSPASGRLASRMVSTSPPEGMNLQNWKEWVRQVLVARPNWKLVKADFSQIELRLTAYFSQDRNLTEAFDKGDAYTYIMWMLDRDTGMFGLAPRCSLADAQGLYASGDEKVRFARRETKTIALGWTYRMGPRKMTNAYGIPFQRAKLALEGLEATFPGVPEWWRSLESEVLRTAQGAGWGYLRNPWGRIRYFFPDEAPTICNFLPQSSAADILFDAMLGIEKASRKLPEKLLLTIHDEVVMESPAPILTAGRLRRIMEAPIEALDGLRIPVDVGIGRNWAKKSKENLQGIAAT